MQNDESKDDGEEKKWYRKEQKKQNEHSSFFSVQARNGREAAGREKVECTADISDQQARVGAVIDGWCE